MSRTSFFLLQAIVGLFIAQSGGSAGSASATPTKLETIVTGARGPLAEVLLMYYQDLQNIKEGGKGQLAVLEARRTWKTGLMVSESQEVLLSRE